MKTILQLGTQSAQEFQLPQLEQLNLQLVELDKRLLTLRFAFGTLKKNIQDAFSPLAAVLLPAVNRAVFAAAQGVKTLGQVIAGLLGVQVAQDKVTASVKKSAAATGAWAKRSLAAFDQINRLQGKSGGGGSGKTAAREEPVQLFPTGLTETAQNLLVLLSGLLEPLKNLDLSAAHWAFERLKEALEALSVAAGETFTKLWHALLVPLAGYLVEQLIPALLSALTAAVYLASDLVTVFGDAMVQLLEAMAPVADFLGRALVEVIEQLRQFFLNAANAIYNNGSQIEGVFQALAQALEMFWFVAGDFLERLLERFSGTFEAIGNIAIRGIENALMAIGDLFYALTGLLDGDMQTFWDGMEKMCKHGANAVIAVANALLRAVTAAVNTVFDALNCMEFDVPAWLPIYGGKKFKFALRQLPAPQIPFLAQGAVLPANKPFLAVVGDQKHGTNIEAPLTTIQEAVALTMGEFSQGQAATVQVLQDILQAVLGISIGDEQVTAAVDRCHARRAVMRGGL